MAPMYAWLSPNGRFRRQGSSIESQTFWFLAGVARRDNRAHRPLDTAPSQVTFFAVSNQNRNVPILTQLEMSRLVFAFCFSLSLFVRRRSFSQKISLPEVLGATIRLSVDLQPLGFSGIVGWDRSEGLRSPKGGAFRTKRRASQRWSRHRLSQGFPLRCPTNRFSPGMIRRRHPLARRPEPDHADARFRPAAGKEPQFRFQPRHVRDTRC